MRCLFHRRPKIRPFYSMNGLPLTDVMQTRQYDIFLTRPGLLQRAVFNWRPSLLQRVVEFSDQVSTHKFATCQLFLHPSTLFHLSTGIPDPDCFHPFQGPNPDLAVPFQGPGLFRLALHSNSCPKRDCFRIPWFCFLPFHSTALHSQTPTPNGIAS